MVWCTVTGEHEVCSEYKHDDETGEPRDITNPTVGETGMVEWTKNEPTLLALYESCILSMVTKGRSEIS